MAADAQVATPLDLETLQILANELSCLASVARRPDQSAGLVDQSRAVTAVLAEVRQLRAKQAEHDRLVADVQQTGFDAHQRVLDELRAMTEQRDAARKLVGVLAETLEAAIEQLRGAAWVLDRYGERRLHANADELAATVLAATRREQERLVEMTRRRYQLWASCPGERTASFGRRAVIARAGSTC